MAGDHTTATISTLIFDVDDTLYDVSTGFSNYRNGEAVQSFMVEHLNFSDRASAQKVRDPYFERYHSTAKALTIAEQEGAFPPPPDPNSKPTNLPRFDPKDLAEYYAANLDFSLLGGEKTQLRKDLEECPLNLVAFSNGPRKYVKRVLIELGLFELFGEERLFAVDEVLPYCKPEREAFEKIFRIVGVLAEECVMIEDSMKNIRRAKELGMKTVLITGAGRIKDRAAGRPTWSASDETVSSTPGELPLENDPDVDLAIETVEELRSALPDLWASPVLFSRKRS
jgi:putative hydrolase of the HAD superfamily